MNISIKIKKEILSVIDYIFEEKECNNSNNNLGIDICKIAESCDISNDRVFQIIKLLKDEGYFHSIKYNSYIVAMRCNKFIRPPKTFNDPIGQPNAMMSIKPNYKKLSEYKNKLEKLIGEKKETSLHANKIIKQESILFSYNSSQERGKLQIKDLKPIEFQRQRALIVKYFWEKKEYTEDYKSYLDFKKEENQNIDSTKFRQDINAINKRVKKETKNQIKGVLELKEKIKNKEMNQYRWKIKT